MTTSLRNQIIDITGSVSSCILGLTPYEATDKILKLIAKRIDDKVEEIEASKTRRSYADKSYSCLTLIEFKEELMKEEVEEEESEDKEEEEEDD